MGGSGRTRGRRHSAYRLHPQTGSVNNGKKVEGLPVTETSKIKFYDVRTDNGSCRADHKIIVQSDIRGPAKHPYVSFATDPGGNPSIGISRFDVTVFGAGNKQLFHWNVASAGNGSPAAFMETNPVNGFKAAKTAEVKLSTSEGPVACTIRFFQQLTNEVEPNIQGPTTVKTCKLRDGWGQIRAARIVHKTGKPNGLDTDLSVFGKDDDTIGGYWSNAGKTADRIKFPPQRAGDPGIDTEVDGGSDNPEGEPISSSALTNSPAGATGTNGYIKASKGGGNLTAFGARVGIKPKDDSQFIGANTCDLKVATLPVPTSQRK